MSEETKKVITEMVKAAQADPVAKAYLKGISDGMKYAPKEGK